DPELVSPTLDGPAFAKVAAPVEGSQDLESTYLVRFRGKADVARFGSTVAKLGGEVIFAHEKAGIAAVSGLSPAAAAQLGAGKDIAGVDADAFVELEGVDASLVESADAPESPTNPAGAAFYGRQWNMKAISAPGAWAAGALGDREIKVGILDTGIDYEHPDLIYRVNLDLSQSFLSAAENARVPAGAHKVADLN